MGGECQAPFHYQPPHSSQVLSENVHPFLGDSTILDYSNAPSAQFPAPERSRKRTKAGIYASDIRLSDLEKWFHLPARQAANKLGVGLTIFKRCARNHGIKVWPYKKPVSKGSDESTSEFESGSTKKTPPGSALNTAGMPPQHQRDHQRDHRQPQVTHYSDAVTSRPRPSPFVVPPATRPILYVSQWQAPDTPREACRPVARHISDDPDTMQPILDTLGVGHTSGHSLHAAQTLHGAEQLAAAGKAEAGFGVPTETLSRLLQGAAADDSLMRLVVGSAQHPGGAGALLQVLLSLPEARRAVERLAMSRSNANFAV